MIDNREITAKAHKYKRDIIDFRDYLLYYHLSPAIRNNDVLYKEYCKLIIKYEEHFHLNDL